MPILVEHSKKYGISCSSTVFTSEMGRKKRTVFQFHFNTSIIHFPYANSVDPLWLLGKQEHILP